MQKGGTMDGSYNPYRLFNEFKVDMGLIIGVGIHYKTHTPILSIFFVH